VKRFPRACYTKHRRLHGAHVALDVRTLGIVVAAQLAKRDPIIVVVDPYRFVVVMFNDRPYHSSKVVANLDGF